MYTFYLYKNLQNKESDDWQNIHWVVNNNLNYNEVFLLFVDINTLNLDISTSALIKKMMLVYYTADKERAFSSIVSNESFITVAAAAHDYVSVF